MERLLSNKNLGASGRVCLSQGIYSITSCLKFILENARVQTGKEIEILGTPNTKRFLLGSLLGEGCCAVRLWTWLGMYSKDMHIQCMHRKGAYKKDREFITRACRDRTWDNGFKPNE